MSDQRFTHAEGMKVAAEICRIITPVSERLIMAGSLRRRKPDIGDLEILYIPMLDLQRDPQDFFKTSMVDLVEQTIRGMIGQGILEMRVNVKGSTAFGPKNKLCRHVSGIPVDFFTANPDNWFNYLVCRTGPAELNMAIAKKAQDKGWKWNPYGTGFSRSSGLGHENFVVRSEKDVFDFVGLPYQEPHQRRAPINPNPY